MNEHAQRQFTVLQTVIKMLNRRGYDVPDNVTARTLNQLESKYVANEVPVLNFLASRNGDNIMVVFFNDQHTAKLGLAPIRELVTMMEEHGCKDALLVVHDGLTSPAASMLRELEAKSGIVITAFQADTLLYDIWEHAAVPRHTLLTPTQRAALLKDLRCTPDQLPRMLRDDPMARYMGLRCGDVVRIDRPSITVGRDVYYRIVVDGDE